MPRSMLAADRTMLHGSSKNTLVDILEKLDTGRDIEVILKRVFIPLRTGITAYTEA